jgi:hypothetical protein
MIYIIGLVIVAAIIYGTVKFAAGDRYHKMTEEEFEAEAKRTSLMGAAVAGLQKTIDPSHRVQYVQEQQERMEADGADSGDKPEAGEKK